jgi:hypothetical protein
MSKRSARIDRHPDAVGRGGGVLGRNVSGSLSAPASAAVDRGRWQRRRRGSGGAVSDGDWYHPDLPDRSSAFVAQSIGGGAATAAARCRQFVGRRQERRLSGVGLGGTGGAGKNGGAVTATTSGGIWTFGNSSTGVLASQ